MTLVAVAICDQAPHAERQPLVFALEQISSRVVLAARLRQARVQVLGKAAAAVLSTFGESGLTELAFTPFVAASRETLSLERDATRSRSSRTSGGPR